MTRPTHQHTHERSYAGHCSLTLQAQGYTERNVQDQVTSVKATRPGLKKVKSVLANVHLFFKIVGRVGPLCNERKTKNKNKDINPDTNDQSGINNCMVL